MINYEGEIYYTSSDLYHEFNDPSNETFLNLSNKFRKVYKKDSSFYISDGYIQLKFYPAAKCKLLSTLYYRQSEKCKKICKAWSIKAINEFLDNPIAAHVQRGCYDAKLIEAEN